MRSISNVSPSRGLNGLPVRHAPDEKLEMVKAETRASRAWGSVSLRDRDCSQAGNGTPCATPACQLPDGCVQQGVILAILGQALREADGLAEVDWHGNLGELQDSDNGGRTGA